MEDGVGRHRGLVSAVEAMADSAILDLAEALTPASRTDKTLRPAKIEEKFAALLLCLKPFHEFDEIYGLLPHLFLPLSSLLLLTIVSHLFSFEAT